MGWPRARPPPGRVRCTRPIASAQARLWFLEQLEPGGAAYHLGAGVRLRGPLDVAALRRAVGALVARHEALRPRVPAGRGGEVQAMAPAGAVGAGPLPVHDLTGGTTPNGSIDPLAGALGLAAEVARAPFDLARGPLLRTALVRLGPDEHLLVVAAHHLAVDGWSVGLLLGELGPLYAAAIDGGEPLAAPAGPGPAVRRRGGLAGGGAWLPERPASACSSTGEACWARARPTGRSRRWGCRPTGHRPPGRSGRGGTVPVAVPASLAGRVRALAVGAGATPYMALLAGYLAVLGRWAEQDDLAVGTPVAGRDHPALEAVVGCFVNTLVVRASLADRPSFRVLLARVRTAVLGALAHADLPFEALVDALRPTRDLARTPLFQAAFAFQNTPGGTLRLGDVALGVPLGLGSTQFDLTLALADAHVDDGSGGGGWVGGLEYDADLFDPETVARFGHHLLTLLEAAVDEPDARLARLALVDADEQARLDALVAGGPALAGPDTTLTALLAAQAARTPAAVAMVGADGVALSYGEVQARATALAARLRALGAGQGSSRSPWASSRGHGPC